jgi:hypothetical protein
MKSILSGVLTGYADLQVGKTGTLLALEFPQAGEAQAEGPAGPPGMVVRRYDFKTRTSDVPLAGVRNFQMSHGGEKALYRQGDNWIIAALRPITDNGCCLASLAGGLINHFKSLDLRWGPAFAPQRSFGRCQSLQFQNLQQPRSPWHKSARTGWPSGPKPVCVITHQ